MKLATILFPTDFSELSNGVLSLATSLARDNSARLLILHVMEPFVSAGAEVGMAAMPVVDTDEQRKQLERIVPFDAAVRYEHRLAEGVAGESIVQVAQKENADLIVMPTHGRSGISRLLMGSVAEHVVRHAPCPVLTVKEPQSGESSSDTATWPADS